MNVRRGRRPYRAPRLAIVLQLEIPKEISTPRARDAQMVARGVPSREGSAAGLRTPAARRPEPGCYQRISTARFGWRPPLRQPRRGRRPARARERSTTTLAFAPATPRARALAQRMQAMVLLTAVLPVRDRGARRSSSFRVRVQALQTFLELLPREEQPRLDGSLGNAEQPRDGGDIMSFDACQ